MSGRESRERERERERERRATQEGNGVTAQWKDYSRDPVANVTDPFDVFVIGRAPDLDTALSANSVPAACTRSTGVVKSTKRCTASGAFTSLVR